ncbi:MAG: hypothetical protein NC222_06310 [Staphylococcus sp.]|nr:hypothetical protein [Staphylococcus sp.]
MKTKFKIFNFVYNVCFYIRRFLGKIFFCIGWFFMYLSSKVFPEIEHLYGGQIQHETKLSKLTLWLGSKLK